MHIDETFDACSAGLPRIEDEIANSITHGIGMALSIVGGVALVVIAARDGGLREIIGCSIFSASLIAVYTASTLSHVFQEPRARRIFRMLDQGCIYLLIAGTFTPLALVYLRGAWWWVLLAAIWAVAALGFASKVLFAYRVDAISMATYVALGWAPVMVSRQMVSLVPAGCMWAMLAGGLCYTVGTLFLKFDRKALYLHAVWHLFVIAGSTVHYFTILHYLVPAA